MKRLLRFLNWIGIYTRRDVDAEWSNGFIHGAKGKGVINERGRWRPLT